MIARSNGAENVRAIDYFYKAPSAAVIEETNEALGAWLEAVSVERSSVQ